MFGVDVVDLFAIGCVVLWVLGVFAIILRHALAGAFSATKQNPTPVRNSRHDSHHSRPQHGSREVTGPAALARRDRAA